MVRVVVYWVYFGVIYGRQFISSMFTKIEIREIRLMIFCLQWLTYNRSCTYVITTGYWDFLKYTLSEY